MLPKLYSVIFVVTSSVGMSAFFSGFGGQVSPLSAQEGVVVGRTVEAGTGRPIPNAQVILRSTDLGALSDGSGRFRIPRVPVGSYLIDVQVLGFEAASEADVVVRSDRETVVEVRLTEVAVQLEGLTVVAPTLFGGVAGATPSRTRIKYEEIRRTAGAIGDVLRLAQALPGVTIVNDQRNDLVVRGGSPAENLTRVDGIEVPNLNHFSAVTSSGGPISMLNTEFIADADFSAGAFSPRYGNRLSSVFDIRLRDGSRTQNAYDVEMGIAGFGFIGEGPLGDRGSWIASLRRSYLDLLKDAIGLTAVPKYWNLNAKFAFEPSERDRIWAVSLTGIDNIEFNVDPADLDDPSLENIDNSQWRTVNGISWRRFLTDDVVGTLTISDALYHDEVTTRDEQVDNQVVFSQNDDTRVSTVRYEVDVDFGPRVRLAAGAESKLFSSALDLAQPLGIFTPLSAEVDRTGPVRVDTTVTSFQTGAYADFEVRPSSRVEVRAGARVDRFGFIGTTRVSPRVALGFNATSTVTLNAAVGRYHQSPELVLLAADPINDQLEPMRADHLVVGAEFRPVESLRFKIEAYAKRYARYPVSTQYPSLSLANAGDDFSGVRGFLIPLVSEGKGRAAGFEAYAQKKKTGAWWGQLSYSFTDSENEALDGVTRRAAFDVPHTLTALGGVEVGPWEFSGKFSFASGRPRTPYLTAESVAQNRAILDLQRINDERFPSYQRLDLRVDRRLNFNTWSIVAFAEILNVTARVNVQQQVWNAKLRAADTIDQYSFLPNIGFNLKF